MNIYDVIVQPLLNEKTQALREQGQYIFEVNRRANKCLIKQAVERIYSVHVTSVNVMNMPAKMGRVGRRQVVRRPVWKKAVVTLKEGERIEALEA